jgi:excinuclease UvrABC nuclease subunit
LEQLEEDQDMASKTVKFNQSGAAKLPNDKPVVYRIQSESGRTNYVGTAKRGRVQERIQEHLDAGKIPGAKVQVQQVSSIQEAEKTEERIIARTQPKYNRQEK